jgi:predicted type IV restriction endonuclease
MLNMTKIREAVERTEIKVKTLSESEKQRLEKSLELTTRELCAYQEIKSIAQAEGKIDLETALFIYNSLGTWNDTKLSYKIILTQLFAQWIGII